MKNEPKCRLRCLVHPLQHQRSRSHGTQAFKHMDNGINYKLKSWGQEMIFEEHQKTHCQAPDFHINTQVNITYKIPVLRIWDVYPGSRIQGQKDSGSRI
jgi:hypothetical protein